MPPFASDPSTRTDEVTVPSESVRLTGLLAVPQNSTALIVFAHGSGSGRHSPRNRFVADVLNRAGLTTMLVDLLTSDEEEIVPAFSISRCSPIVSSTSPVGCARGRH